MNVPSNWMVGAAAVGDSAYGGPAQGCGCALHPYDCIFELPPRMPRAVLTLSKEPDVVAWPAMRDSNLTKTHLLMVLLTFVNVKRLFIISGFRFRLGLVTRE